MSRFPLLAVLTALAVASCLSKPTAKGGSDIPADAVEDVAGGDAGLDTAPRPDGPPDEAVSDTRGMDLQDVVPQDEIGPDGSDIEIPTPLDSVGDTEQEGDHIAPPETMDSEGVADTAVLSDVPDVLEVSTDAFNVDVLPDEVCTPDCDGKECGDDGCGGDCGTCNDGNVCTDDQCGELGNCLYPNNTASCDDGNPCTENDTCGEGNCAGQWFPLDDLAGLQCVCLSDLDCGPMQDEDPCNGNLVCTPLAPPDPLGYCAVDPASVPDCDDKVFCNGLETCVPNKGCEPGTLQVDDGVDCTVDSCDEENDVVVHEPDDTSCDDNNACTDDVCEKAVGCVHTNNTLGCDDGDACTENDACAGGQCLGVEVQCDDGNPCTDDSCDKATGCAAANNSAPCSDGNACTAPDVCAEGKCTAGPAVACDDKNECTSDTCLPAVGCVFVNNQNACDNGDKCDGPDVCKDGSCVGPPVVCDDKNPCTDDGCQPASGCLYQPDDGNDCSDGNPCNGTETCKAGGCKPGSQLDCDDGNSCTVDGCASPGGCTHTNAVDGIGCPGGPQFVCQAGSCVCKPACAGKQCGPDGCGALCGMCKFGWLCDAVGMCQDACGDVSGLQAGAPWPTYGYCGTRIGRSPFLAPENPKILWQAPKCNDASGYSAQAAVAADGKVFVADYGLAPKKGAICAYAPTGESLWKAQVYGNMYGSPTIAADGTIYVVGNSLDTPNVKECFLHAFTPDGGLKWSAKMFYDDEFSTFPCTTSGAPLAVSGGVVYAAAHRLQAFSKTGATLWTLPDLQTDAAPAIGADGSIYVSRQAGLAFLVTKVTGAGTAAWTATAFDATPGGGCSYYGPNLEGVTVSLLGGERVLVGTPCSSATLAALTPSGQQAWATPLSQMPSAQAGMSPPAVGPGGNAVVSSYGYTQWESESRVHSVGPSGAVSWSIEPSSYLMPTVIDGAGHILLPVTTSGGKEGGYQVFDSDGTEVAKYQQWLPAYALVVAGDRKLVVTGPLGMYEVGE